MRQQITNPSSHPLYHRWKKIKKDADGVWQDFSRFVCWFEDMMFVEGLQEFDFKDIKVVRLDKDDEWSAWNCKIQPARAFYEPECVTVIPLDLVACVRLFVKTDEKGRWSTYNVARIFGLGIGTTYNLIVGNTYPGADKIEAPLEKNWNGLNTQFRKFILQARNNSVAIRNANL